MAAILVTHPAPSPGMKEKPVYFHLFPRLPSEIQIKIWKLSMPECRKMYLKVNYIPWKNCEPPALLLVNTQSREIAQEVYRICILPSSGPQKAIYMTLYDEIYFLKWCRRTVRVYWARARQLSIFDPCKKQFAGKTFTFSTQTIKVFNLVQLSMYRDEGYMALNKNTEGLFDACYGENIPLNLWIEFTKTPEMEKNMTWNRSGGRLVRGR